MSKVITTSDTAKLRKITLAKIKFMSCAGLIVNKSSTGSYAQAVEMKKQLAAKGIPSLVYINDVYWLRKGTAI